MQSTELQSYIQERVTIEPATGCWIWKLSLDAKGYGFCGLRDYRNKAHRVSYSAFKGELVPGLEIDHLCRVTSCVNPEHLEQVTRQVNMRRKVAATVGRHYTVYFSEHKEIWRAGITVQSSPRKRKVFSSKDRGVAIRKAEEWIEGHPIGADL